MLHAVDAHALVWHFEKNPKLGASAKSILDDPASELVIPAIALAEACWVVETGRCGISDPKSMIDLVARDKRMRVSAVDSHVVAKCQELAVRGVKEMHDRQIVATALLLESDATPVTLLTKNANIIASGIVHTLW